MDALRREKIVNAIHVILNDCSLRNHHMLYNDAIAILKDYERDYGLYKSVNKKIDKYVEKFDISRKEAFDLLIVAGLGAAGMPNYEYDENDIFAMEVISSVMRCLERGYLNNRSGKQYSKNERSRNWERSRTALLKGVENAIK